jgi:hypothetical protein
MKKLSEWSHERMFNLLRKSRYEVDEEADTIVWFEFPGTRKQSKGCMLCGEKKCVCNSSLRWMKVQSTIFRSCCGIIRDPPQKNLASIADNCTNCRF